MRMRAVAAVSLLVLSGAVATAPAAGARPAAQPGTCPPRGAALGYSDALDKADVGGVRVGGLSDLAYDRRTRAWASTVDNNKTDPSRIWFFRDLARPRIVGAPLVLKNADGVPYTGMTADDEGLAVLPSGEFVVSSETEPSIRIFGRDGVQRASLPVPARFRVAPAGEATGNATLEGLTLTPSGRTLVASMEGALSGDVSPSGDATFHRFLVYSRTGKGWTLTKQVAYRARTGQRIPEIAAVDDDRLIVEEASYDPATGNAVSLYAVSGLRRAADVTRVPNLSGDPGSALRKTLLADVVRCPTLGATAKQPQTNPLLDNYEGMAITARGPLGLTGVTLISDDNFGATQITRVLNLAVVLPKR
ncbi:esterase-like activity of phytase family protein [Jatrophihabitans fulvus]